MKHYRGVGIFHIIVAENNDDKPTNVDKPASAYH